MKELFGIGRKVHPTARHRKKERGPPTTPIVFLYIPLAGQASFFLLSFQATSNKKRLQLHAMGKHPLGCVLIFSVIASLGLVSFASCLVAEAKRPKKAKVDLKLDGKLCFLPTSHAFEFGVAASICLSIAQILGNLVLCANYRSAGKTRKAKKPILSAILLSFSWISFGVAVVLISAATSMSGRQPYGKGWLDGECYIVRDGVYISSGVLSLLAVLALLGAAAVMITTNQVDQGQKIYAPNA